ncbi:hypothetical protein SPFM12_00237 [Salmonella phage SPFM12]|nr:hypothetical protein SPFM12_00237 [Salmonella phage SPFM12]
MKIDQLGKAVEENVKAYHKNNQAQEQSVSTPSAQTLSSLVAFFNKVNGDDLEASFNVIDAEGSVTAGKAGEVQLLGNQIGKAEVVGAVEGGKLGSGFAAAVNKASSIGSIYGEQDAVVAAATTMNLTTGGKFVGDDINVLKGVLAALRGLGKQKKDTVSGGFIKRWLKFSNQGKSIQARAKKYDKAFLQRIYDWLKEQGRKVKDESYGARKRRQVARESLWDDIVAQESIRKRWAFDHRVSVAQGEEPMEVEEDMPDEAAEQLDDAQLEAVDAAEAAADGEGEDKPIDQLDAEADVLAEDGDETGIELPAESVEGTLADIEHDTFVKSKLARESVEGTGTVVPDDKSLMAVHGVPPRG